MQYLALSLLLALATTAPRAAELTDAELRWLKAGWPVVTYAKTQKLPIDIVVQPQSHPGDAPLAMGYEDGRCKLVLSMRGNPDVDAAVADVESAVAPVVIEAMFAHELAHCWRYVRGTWHALPAGFRDRADVPGDPALADARRSMRDTRREEGFADLVGLAWTKSRHPERYAQVHAWLEAYRAEQPVAGAHHDTRVWVRLARDPQALADGATPFEQVDSLWRKGLIEEN